MSDGKRLPDEKRYALMSKHSIRAFAESVGITDVSDEVASILQEDVIYRLREVIQVPLYQVISVLLSLDKALGIVVWSSRRPT